MQKVITGPSARFAEVVAYAWGNNRSGSRTISEDETHLTSQGLFFDLEKNSLVTIEVKRRIVDKDGRRYSPDLIGTTANAAGSIASRNAILKAIPKAWWNDIFEKAQEVVKGKAETLGARRSKALEKFRAFAMTPAMVYQVLGVGGQSEITLDHLAMASGILTALKDGEVSVEALMSEAGGADAAVAAKGKSTIENIKRQYQPKPKQYDVAKPPEENLDAEPAPDVHEQAKAAQQKLDQRRQQTKDGVPMEEGW